MITKAQVRLAIKEALNGTLPLWGTSSDNKLDTLEHIYYRLNNEGCNTEEYLNLVRDYLKVRFIDLPDNEVQFNSYTIDEILAKL